MAYHRTRMEPRIWQEDVRNWILKATGWPSHLQASYQWTKDCNNGLGWWLIHFYKDSQRIGCSQAAVKGYIRCEGHWGTRKDHRHWNLKKLWREDDISVPETVYTRHTVSLWPPRRIPSHHTTWPKCHTVQAHSDKLKSQTQTQILVHDWFPVILSTWD